MALSLDPKRWAAKRAAAKAAPAVAKKSTAKKAPVKASRKAAKKAAAKRSGAASRPGNEVFALLGRTGTGQCLVAVTGTAL